MRKRSRGFFETPRASEKQVSILNLDEYLALLKHPDVERTPGLQCPFGQLAAKDTDWVHFGVPLHAGDADSMPSPSSKVV